MAPRTRTANPRRTTRKPSSGVLALDRPENVTLLAEREPLFSIGEREYTIPRHVPASLSMRVLETAREDGDGLATDLAMHEMLGDDGWDALKNCRTLTRTDLQTVIQIVMDKVLPTGVYGPKAASDTPDSTKD